MSDNIQSNKILHAPSDPIQDGSPYKKRLYDEKASPISNKKVKEIDTSAVLQSNNKYEALAAEVLMGDTTLPTKDIMCNGAPTYRAVYITLSSK